MKEYIFLGNTGVQVSKICLGCMSYGTPGWPPAPWTVALAWLLSKEVVTAPIIGVTKRSHITDAVDSLSLNLNDEEITALEAAYTPKPSFGITPPYAIPAAGTLHDRG